MFSVLTEMVPFLLCSIVLILNCYLKASAIARLLSIWQPRLSLWVK